VKLTAQITAAVLLLAFCFAEARAQKPRVLSSYAIQIQLKGNPVFYEPIYESDLAVENKLFWFSPCCYTRKSSRDEDFISLIKLFVSPEGGEWKIKISVVMGAFRDKGERVVATYRTRLNQMTPVDEIEKLGVGSFEVGIVAIKPEEATRPEIINKTTSLAVLNLVSEVVPSPYQLLLQHLSHKRVAALEVDSYSDGKRIMITWPRGDFNQPLIEAGATYEVRIKSTSGPSSSSGGYQRKPERFEIVSVVFADGTFEGDEFLAAQVNAKMAVAKLQLQRVIALLEAARVAGGAPAPEIISNLSKGTFALRDYPTSEEIKPVSDRFPALNVMQRDFLRTNATQGLHAVKASLRFDITQFRLTNTTDRTLLKDWLKRMREKYETWLGGL